MTLSVPWQYQGRLNEVLLLVINGGGLIDGGVSFWGGPAVTLSVRLQYQGRLNEVLLSVINGGSYL